MEATPPPLPPPPQDEEVVELELLLSVELLRLLWLSSEFFFCLRRLARGAVATSCSRNPSRVAWWKASMVVLIWSWICSWALSRMPGVQRGVCDMGEVPWPPLPPFRRIHLCLSKSCMRRRFLGSTVRRPTGRLVERDEFLYFGLGSE